MKLLQPRKALNKGYLRAPIDNDSYNNFIDSLATLRSNIKDGQNEETQKGYFKDFLRDTFYGDYKIDTTERIDLAIRLNNRPNSNIGVMFEFKTLKRNEKNGRGLWFGVLQRILTDRATNEPIGL